MFTISGYAFRYEAQRSYSAGSHHVKYGKLLVAVPRVVKSNVWQWALAVVYVDFHHHAYSVIDKKMSNGKTSVLIKDAMPCINFDGVDYSVRVSTQFATHRTPTYWHTANYQGMGMDVMFQRNESLERWVSAFGS